MRLKTHAPSSVGNQEDAPWGIPTGRGHSVLVIFRGDEGVCFIFASYWSDAMVGGEGVLWSGVDGGGDTVMGVYRRLKPSASKKALQLAGYKFVSLSCA